MPTRGMYDTWISGSDVNPFCCYGLVYLFWIVFEKPNRSSFTIIQGEQRNIPPPLHTQGHTHTREWAATLTT